MKLPLKRRNFCAWDADDHLVFVGNDAGEIDAIINILNASQQANSDLAFVLPLAEAYDYEKSSKRLRDIRSHVEARRTSANERLELDAELVNEQLGKLVVTAHSYREQ